MPSPLLPTPAHSCYNKRMSRLSEKEAEQARRRGLAYEHSMLIEGITLTPEIKAMVDHVDAERMGYEEGVQYGIEWLRQRGMLPPLTEAKDE